MRKTFDTLKNARQCKEYENGPWDVDVPYFFGFICDKRMNGLGVVMVHFVKISRDSDHGESPPSVADFAASYANGKDYECLYNVDDASDLSKCAHLFF
jgi:hypothetical protein